MLTSDLHPTVTRHELTVTVWLTDEPGRDDPRSGAVCGAVALTLAEAGLDVDVTHVGFDRTSVRIVQENPSTLEAVLTEVPRG